MLNFTKAGVKVKKQLSAQARQLLEVQLWGVPPTAQARDKLAAGDRVLVFVGAPERVFIGDATIASGYHTWTPDEAATYPGTFEAGIVLANAGIWQKPVRLSNVWPKCEASESNPNALWYGAAVRLPKPQSTAAGLS